MDHHPFADPLGKRVIIYQLRRKPCPPKPSMQAHQGPGDRIQMRMTAPEASGATREVSDRI